MLKNSHKNSHRKRYQIPIAQTNSGLKRSIHGGIYNKLSPQDESLSLPMTHWSPSWWESPPEGSNTWVRWGEVRSGPHLLHSAIPYPWESGRAAAPSYWTKAERTSGQLLTPAVSTQISLVLLKMFMLLLYFFLVFSFIPKALQFPIHSLIWPPSSLPWWVWGRCLPALLCVWCITNCSHRALTSQTMVKQATCQEKAMQAPPKKGKAMISGSQSTKEKDTVSHYSIYLLEGTGKLIQVSIGKVPGFFLHLSGLFW